MKNNIKKLLIGASVIASFGAIASSPASAASLQTPSIGGSNPTDYLLYCADATSTFTGPTCTDSLSTILTGNAASPTGNVELASNSEKAGFDFSKNTTLSGTLNGKNITLSSLTQSDWTPSFTQQWLGDALAANNVVINPTGLSFLTNIFVSYGGRQRFSDPNIAYVNQNDTTGQISIGLAGHLNATSLLTTSIEQYIAAQTVGSTNWLAAKGIKSTLSSKTIQASEIVKVSYNGGPSQLLYSFKATNSGLVNNKGVGTDGVSHTGNYEVTLNGVPASKVPEPSAMLGLLGVGGFFAVKRKLAKKA